ncbi:Ferritin [Heracleum sosnowskyi]|uniref:Ferritin n=1 Tax=Heracleum sosnowskyi TaxID=360622 RepID=A0AAD8GNZ9_9APIA|nr:Ferritin [Heracleum sosnowskyi]
MCSLASFLAIEGTNFGTILASKPKSLSSSSMMSSQAHLNCKMHFYPRKRAGVSVAVSVSVSASVEIDGGNSMPVSGLVFQPFEEVKNEAFVAPVAPQVSIARQRFTDECEAAINEQINVEYNNSYVYHAMFAYFDRDNIALKGLAKFFKDSSEEERTHAEMLMEYQNMRGGRVKLHSIMNPPSEFDNAEKGDALYAMELALSLEKLTNEKLLSLHKVADRCNDPQLADFIESKFLDEQVEAIKKISDYVSQLRRVGKGHGVWHFDQSLLLEGEAAV